MLTRPSTPKKTARITTSGIKINYCYYSSPILRVLGNIGQDVPVRYEPFNMGIAYAYLDGKWHECRSQYYLAFKDRSERELKFASEQLREKFRLAGRQDRVNANQLADFLLSVEAEERLEMQRLHQLESESHRDLSNRSHCDKQEEAFLTRIQADDEIPPNVPYEPKILGEF